MTKDTVINLTLEGLRDPLQTLVRSVGGPRRSSLWVSETTAEIMGRVRLRALESDFMRPRSLTEFISNSLNAEVNALSGSPAKERSSRVLGTGEAQRDSWWEVDAA